LIIDVGCKRFGERVEIRELVLHSVRNLGTVEYALECRKIAQALAKSMGIVEGTEDYQMFEAFVVLKKQAEDIRYPWDSSLPQWMLLFCDGHILIAHPVPKYARLFKNMFDFWQYSWETLLEREGDCEDKGILICSLLRILGYEAYTVIGYVEIEGQKYGHGWAEVKIGSESYIMEGTLSPQILNKISYKTYFQKMKCSDLYGKLYHPILKFNEEKLEIVGTEQEVAERLKLKPKMKLRKRHKKLIKLLFE